MACLVQDGPHFKRPFLGEHALPGQPDLDALLQDLGIDAGSRALDDRSRIVLGLEQARDDLLVGQHRRSLGLEADERGVRDIAV